MRPWRSVVTVAKVTFRCGHLLLPRGGRRCGGAHGYLSPRLLTRPHLHTRQPQSHCDLLPRRTHTQHTNDRQHPPTQPLHRDHKKGVRRGKQYRKADGMYQRRVLPLSTSEAKCVCVSAI